MYMFFIMSAKNEDENLTKNQIAVTLINGMLFATKYYDFIDSYLRY